MPLNFAAYSARNFPNSRNHTLNLNTTPRYDYIIAGAGCAGLSLLMHMIRSGKFHDKRILLIDKEPKKENDRTWCFWEMNPGPFEQVVQYQWEKVWFHSDTFSSLLSLSPYTYKLIRGIDFYEYCFSVIGQHPNIEVRYENIQHIVNDEKGVAVITASQRLEAEYIFNSIIFNKPSPSPGEYHLIQHFKGWIVETKDSVFDPAQATLMDFRVGQQQGTSFVYIMPFAPNRALVEYTLFSADLLAAGEYDTALHNYITDHLHTEDYSVSAQEFGMIPMTNYNFPTHRGNIINIGTAGGQTKPSSGYTFQFIQKHSARIVEKLMAGLHPTVAGNKKRFRFYDSTLLDILANKTIPGKKIFTTLFEKNKPQQVLRFLDNESTFGDELRIISSLPTWPFLQAAFKQI